MAREILHPALARCHLLAEQSCARTLPSAVLVPVEISVARGQKEGTAHAHQPRKVTTMTEPPLRAFGEAIRLTAGPALQRSGHGLAHSLARLLRDTQHGRHRIGHRCRIGDRGQLENPNTIREFVDQAPGYLGRKRRLADAANRVCPVSINLTLTDSRNAGYPATPRSAARASIVLAFKYFGGIALTEVGD
jgi:hypothetical protein